MKCNVGGTDRALRVLAGVALLVLGFVFHTYWGLVGIVPLFTGLFRFCPAYTLFKIDTNRKG